MAYEPLHHKYRPQTFNDLVGQVAISNTLINAIKLEKIAPAYLFTGPRGTGKTSSARILAKSLNCLSSPQPTAEPCGECDVCQAIASGNALDVIEIDAASNTGVDNIREIIERSRFAPVQSRFKVYAIDECHMLSTAAFNALLKTLEEPPPQVVFILATTDPQRVLPTIISRCQRFDYRRIPIEEMVKHLQYIAQQENISITTEALTLNAQIANGGLRDAESLLDQLSLLPNQITVTDIWDLVGAVPEQDLLTLLIAIRKQSIEDILTQCRNLLDRGKEPLVLLQSLANFYINLLTAKTAPQRQDLVAITETCWQQLVSEAENWQLAQILWGQQQLKSAETQIKHSTQPRLWLEVTLLSLLQTDLANTAPHPQSLSRNRNQATSNPVSTVPPQTTHQKDLATVSQPTAKQPTAKQPATTTTGTNFPQNKPDQQPQTVVSELKPQSIASQSITQNSDLAPNPDLVSAKQQDNIPQQTIPELPTKSTNSAPDNQVEAIANPALFYLNQEIVAPAPEPNIAEIQQPTKSSVSQQAEEIAEQRNFEIQPGNPEQSTNNPQLTEIAPQEIHQPNFANSAPPATNPATPELGRTSEVVSPITPVATPPIATPPVENRPAETFPTIDFEEIWTKVIACIHPPMTQALMRQQCHLIDLTHGLATVGISSAPLQKINQGKIPNIEAAFAQVCDRKIKVVLEVSQLKKNSSQQTNLDSGKSQAHSTFNKVPANAPSNTNPPTANQNNANPNIHDPQITTTETPVAVATATATLPIQQPTAIASTKDISPIQTAIPVLETPSLATRDRLTPIIPKQTKSTTTSQDQTNHKSLESLSEAPTTPIPQSSGNFSKAVELVAKKFEGEIIELESSFPLPTSNSNQLAEAPKHSTPVNSHQPNSSQTNSRQQDLTQVNSTQPNFTQPETPQIKSVTPTQIEPVAKNAIATDPPLQHNLETVPNNNQEQQLPEKQAIISEIPSESATQSQPKIIIKREATSNYDYDDEDIPF